MMWKCRNCHLRETKFAKFHGFIGDHTPRWPTSLEACTLGTCVSAFVAKKYSLFSFKRGCNSSTCNWARDFTEILTKNVLFVHSSLTDPSSSEPF